MDTERKAAANAHCFARCSITMSFLRWQMLLLKQNSQASLAALEVDSDIVDLALFMKLQILYRSL